MSSIEPTTTDLRAESTFADLLRSFRAAANLTQEQLSERSGVSVRAISDLERGVKSRPQRATIALLADGLDLSQAERIRLERSVPRRRRQAKQAGHSLDLPIGGFLGSVPEAAIVARVDELQRIRSLVEDVRRGEGRVLLLRGEAGVGKTRLAQKQP